MAINPGLLPNDGAPIAGPGGLATQEWRDFFLLLASNAESEDLQAELLAIAERVTALEASGGSLATLVGVNGISVFGQITDDLVRIQLTAALANLSDVSDAEPAEGDRLTWDAALSAWMPKPDPPAGIYAPMVTGEIDADQPVFMYFGDGSLFMVQVA